MRLPPSTPPSSQRGGIAILVVLMLLVLLTLAAVGMSRNSFREIVTLGTARQGAGARNLADSGIEFSILWLQPSSQLPAPSGSSAEKLQTLSQTLVAGLKYGSPYKVDDGSPYTGTDTSTPPNDRQIPSGSGNGFNLALTAMGKMPTTDQSQTMGSFSSGYTPAAGTTNLAAQDIWCVRSDGVLNANGVMKFTHSKEAWISTPPR